MIKVVVFDVGGVLLNNYCVGDYKEMWEEIGKEYNIRSLKIMKVAWLRLWPKMKKGKITENTFWKSFLRICKSDKKDIKRCKKIFRKYGFELGNLDVVKRVNKNYRLAILSNSAKEWFDYRIKKFGVKKYFKIMVNSHTYGTAKPELKIYKILLKKLKVKASECVFIDDHRVNLMAAKLLGFETVFFKDKKQLISGLKKLGVKV